MNRTRIYRITGAAGREQAPNGERTNDDPEPPPNGTGAGDANAMRHGEHGGGRGGDTGGEPNRGPDRVLESVGPNSGVGGIRFNIRSRAIPINLYNGPL